MHVPEKIYRNVNLVHFQYILVISWRSGQYWKNHWHATRHWQTYTRLQYDNVLPCFLLFPLQTMLKTRPQNSELFICATLNLCTAKTFRAKYKNIYSLKPMLNFCHQRSELVHHGALVITNLKLLITMML